jgi:glucose dehydrogenase
MPRNGLLSASALALIFAGLVSSAPNVRGQTFVGTTAPQQFARTGLPSTQNGEWPAYAGDVRGTRYSPLSQIDAANFNRLQVAWRFKTDNFGPYPEWKLE